VAPERVRLPADPGSAGRARSFTAGRFAAVGMGKTATDIGLLLVSELATNALRHAGTAFEVEVRTTPTGIRVAVSDDDPARPREPQVLPGPEAEGGRGMAILEELADRWGVAGDPPGKTVWFELDRH
jgi:sigma-B regulation protein RsbU (phosphoserine phosphatase)